MSSNVEHKNMPNSQTISEHEIETFFSVQSRLACLRNGMKVETKSPLTKELEKLSGLPFVSFPLKFSIYHPGEAKIFIADKEAGIITNPDVDVILEKSTPSAFGRGATTVVDEKYRSGREIQAADIQLSPEEPWISKTFIRDIQTKVSSAMFPGRDAVPKLYKLAIYKEGGHFDWHMDTTHSDQHHATILLALNTSWAGGDLLLRRNGVETRVDMKPKTVTTKNGSKTVLQVVAFYTDTEHKVEPVSQGVRIVLQYDVQVKGWSKGNDRKRGTEDEDENKDNAEEREDENEDEDDDDKDDDDDDDEDDEDTYDSPLQRVEAIYYQHQPFQKAAPLGGDPTVIHNITVIIKNLLESGVEELGFATQYLYRKSSILPEFLKGADAALYQALAATFDVSLHPIVLAEQSDYEGGYSALGYDTFGDSNGGSGTDPELLATTDKSDEPDLESDESDSDVESDDSEGTPTSTVFYVPKVSAVKLISSEEYIEYTGNEAQPAEHKYFGGGMFVRLRRTV